MWTDYAKWRGTIDWEDVEMGASLEEERLNVEQKAAAEPLRRSKTKPESAYKRRMADEAAVRGAVLAGIHVPRPKRHRRDNM